VAIVAVLEEEPSMLIAVARFVRDPQRPDEAEAAFTVCDPLQRLGLGRCLGEALADAARAHGIRRFTATLLGENAAARGLVAAISDRVETRYADGFATLVAELSDG
jgi:hypothetical protein